MMKIFLTAFVLISTQLLNAQDKKKIYESDVLTEKSIAKTVEPNEKVCFDKRFYYKSTINGRQLVGCFLVNTKLGLVTTFLPNNTSAPECEFNVNEKLFRCMLWGMKGNEYTYFNKLEKKKQADEAQLMHYVSTGNSHRNPLAEVMESKILYNKQTTQEFCGGKYKALAYKSDNEKDTLYLFGKEYPNDLVAYAFLGAYGLGYLKTNKGNYFVMSYTHGQSNFKLNEMEDLEDAMLCFDPSAFKVYEETKIPKDIEIAKDYGHKLDSDLAKAEQKMMKGTACAEKKYAFLAYKKAENEKKKELLEKFKDQKVSFRNQNTVNELASNYGFIDAIKMEKLEDEYNLCVLQKQLENTKNSANYAKLSERISCIQKRVVAYTKFENDMNAIGDRNRNDLKKAIKEKGEYYINNVMPKMGDLRCK